MTLVSAFDPIDIEDIKVIKKIHSLTGKKVILSLLKDGVASYKYRYEMLQQVKEDLPYIEIASKDEKLLIYDEKKNAYIKDGREFYKRKINKDEIRRGKDMHIPSKVFTFICTKKIYFADILSSYLTNSRYEHSCRVAITAFNIAKNYRFDKYLALQAGLFHDSGRNLKTDKQISILKKMNIDTSLFPQYSYHQFSSAYLARHNFGIEDKKVLNAIKYHCTGYKKMSLLEMCIYVSDKCEPGRKFPTEEVYNTAKIDLEKALIMTLKEQVEVYKKLNIDPCSNPYTKAMYQKYIPDYFKGGQDD